MSKSQTSAYNYIYYPELNLIREECHPATIDRVKNILIIKQYILKSKVTDFTLDTFSDLISKLPDWDLTEYFQIKNRINHDYSEIHKCSCSPFLEIEENNGKLTTCI